MCRNCEVRLGGPNGAHVTLGGVVLTKNAEDKRMMHFQVKDGELNWEPCTSIPEKRM